MHSFLVRVYNFVLAKLSSRGFIIFILALFVVQALWIALSFRYSMLYDESFHVDAIKLFSQQLSPYITNQPISYDKYGSLSHGWATLFHYAMSFPYRVIAIFTQNLTAQVILLRILCIAMATTGIYLFSVLFRKMRIKQIYANIALLIYVLLPITPFVAATISYDNMLLPLSMLYLIVSLGILKNRGIDAKSYIWLIIIGCVASLVKFTFLPIFAASLLFIAIYEYRKHRNSLLDKFIVSIKSNTKTYNYSMAVLAIIVISWFSSIFLYNLAVYHAVNPSCAKLMDEKRCESSGLVQREKQAMAIRSELQQTSMGIEQYVQYWVNHMVNWSVTTGARPTDGSTVVADPAPILYKLVYFAMIAGLAVLVYAWRSLQKDVNWYYLLIVSVALTAAEFLQNYLLYKKLLYPYSIQPRYLMGVVPLIIVMCVVAYAFVLRNLRPAYKLTIVSLFLLTMLLGGGGLSTHILLSQDTWYWDNSVVQGVNESAKKVLHLLVIGI